jgi:flagellar basal body-associated protein FliL
MLMKQGETYTEPTELPAGQGNKKQVIIIIAVLFLLLVTAVMFTTRKSDDKQQPQDSDIETSPAVKGLEYTPEEIYELQLRGYTMSQIKQAAEDYIYAEDLIAEKDAEIEKKRKEREAALADVNSPAYKALLAQTPLGEPGVAFPKDIAHAEPVVFIRENVDFVKLPTHGEQLFLKLTRPNGNHLFMGITPERWRELPDSGNIVVDFLSTKYGNNEYITDIKEYVLP